MDFGSQPGLTGEGVLDVAAERLKLFPRGGASERFWDEGAVGGEDTRDLRRFQPVTLINAGSSQRLSVADSEVGAGLRVPLETGLGQPRLPGFSPGTDGGGPEVFRILHPVIGEAAGGSQRVR